MAPKTVLITGASEGGIGDALARAFHKKGLRVFATARNLAKVQHLKELGLDVLQLDVVDDASIKKAVESVRSATGGTLDILVNNSGGGYSMPLLDSDPATAKKMFDVNVFGLITVTQAFSPLLIASKGTVMNIGSIAGVIPGPWSGWYNASKATANLLTDQLRLELSPFGVKVILVMTGQVKTKFFENMPSAPSLPASSPYFAAKDEIESQIKGSEAQMMKDGLDVEVYAEAVVRNALKASPKKHHWIGGFASAIWFFNTFAWATVWDWIVPSIAKLPLITKQIDAAAKSK